MPNKEFIQKIKASVIVIDEALYYVNQTLQYGVSEYKLSNVLPKEFKSTLPSIEEIEAELNKE